MVQKNIKAKKILLVTHNARFLVQFELNDIELLKEMGYEVHSATNFHDETMIANAADILKSHGVIIHQIDIQRKPWHIISQIRGYKQLKELLNSEKFSMMHCHTPMGGVIGRMAAKSVGFCPVIYTAHGFHFYKGCPKKNILFYKTIEKHFAKYTDGLITINKEDYSAANEFNIRGKSYLVHGVGVNLKEINNTIVDRTEMRKELDIPLNAFVYISVGEINNNKNHETAIRAFAKLNLANAYYLICGTGPNQQKLIDLSKELGVYDKVKFLGFRDDVIKILKISDCFVFPSYREGLSVALMEAMASGLPCIASSIRGNVDLLSNSKFLFDPRNSDELCECEKKVMIAELRKNEIEKNSKTLELYSIENVTTEMKNIYTEIANY